VLVAGVVVEYLPQIAPQGLRAKYRLEQLYPQALGFPPVPMAQPPASLVKVKSQQAEEDNCEPHSKP
jgi:hypothetical protein